MAQLGWSALFVTSPMTSLGVLPFGFLLATLRIVPLSFIAFAGLPLPWVGRLGLALVLCLVLSPAVSAAIPASGLSWSMAFWLPLVAREILVGASLGFVVLCLFEVIQAAGLLVGGSGAAGTIVGNAMGDAGQVFFQLLTCLALAVFFQLQGFGQWVLAIGRSYEALPLVPAIGVSTVGSAILFVAKAATLLLESALGLAAPILLPLFVLDIGVAVIARFSRLGDFVVGARDWLATVCLLIFSLLFVRLWEVVSRAWLHTLQQLVETLGGQ